jgi:hypothetical protein
MSRRTTDDSPHTPHTPHTRCCCCHAHSRDPTTCHARARPSKPAAVGHRWPTTADPPWNENDPLLMLRIADHGCCCRRCCCCCCCCVKARELSPTPMVRHYCKLLGTGLLWERGQLASAVPHGTLAAASLRAASKRPESIARPSTLRHADRWPRLVQLKVVPSAPKQIGATPASLADCMCCYCSCSGATSGAAVSCSVPLRDSNGAILCATRCIRDAARPRTQQNRPTA